MNKIDWKDVAARTVKTFIATFIGALSFGDVLFVIKDTEGLTRYVAASLISAASAGITAVWNMLLELFGDRINALLDRVFNLIFPKNQNDPAAGATATVSNDDRADYDGDYIDYEEDPADEGEVE